MTCKAGDGAVVEMVVNSDTMQPCIYENQVGARGTGSYRGEVERRQWCSDAAHAVVW